MDASIALEALSPAELKKAEKAVKQAQCSQPAYKNPANPSQGYIFRPNGYRFRPTEELKALSEAEEARTKGTGSNPKTMTYKLRLHNLLVAHRNA